jgi:tripartite-type tricarboxylate transporter receptor subunit TctC
VTSLPLVTSCEIKVQSDKERQMMHGWKKHLGIALVLSTCAIFLAAGFAHGESYPSRPVRMIVPYSPGGATDTPARIVAQRLSDALGHQVVEDNRPGAGGIIGTDTVAKAAPDGYTVLAIGTPLVIIPHIQKTLPYDTFKELVPVMQFGSQPYVLVVHPSLGASSVKQLISLARACRDTTRCCGSV